MGYDLGRFRAAALCIRDDLQLPEASIGIYDWVLAWDHATGQAWIVSTGFPEADAARRRRRAAARLAISQWLTMAVAPEPDNCSEASGVQPNVWRAWLCRSRNNFSPDRYAETLRRAIDYIHAGDCFQVNIAQRLRAR